MPSERSQSTPRLEPPRVATRVVLCAGIGLLLFLGVSLVLMHFYYRSAIEQAVFVPPSPFAKPRLQTNDRSDLASLEAKQRSTLQNYAWIDREKGIVAIPIEEAMKRILSRGGDPYAPIERAADATATEEPKR